MPSPFNTAETPGYERPCPQDIIKRLSSITLNDTAPVDAVLHSETCDAFGGEGEPLPMAVADHDVPTTVPAVSESVCAREAIPDAAPTPPMRAHETRLPPAEVVEEHGFVFSPCKRYAVFDGKYKLRRELYDAMRGYQREGVAVMCRWYEQGMGGLLADEVGYVVGWVVVWVGVGGCVRRN